MSYRRIQLYFFVTILTLSLLLTLAVFRSYFVLLAFGGVLAVVAKPLYRRFLAWFRGEGVAAFLTVLCVTIIVVLPLTYLSTALVSEILDVLSVARNSVGSQTLVQDLTRVLPDSAHTYIPTIVSGAKSVMASFAGQVSSGFIGFFSDLFQVILGTFVVMFAGYYLLKDGDKLKKEVLLLSPMSDEYDELVIDRVAVAVRVVIGGVLVIALVKAVVAGLAFWAVGILNNISRWKPVTNNG
jgi:predicted PurR-regulated permease PerM